jgi:hypothetical protein
MRKRNGYAALIAGAAVAALAIVPAAIGDGHSDLLRSGIAGSTPLTATPPGPVLFGISPAGAPWVANRHSSIRVKRNGDVRIKVRGLVIPGRVAPDLPNPLPTLVAAVVCNGDGVGAMKTDPVSFSANGNANIRQKLKLPKPCLAPAVLFLTPGGAYIGASG